MSDDEGASLQALATALVGGIIMLGILLAVGFIALPLFPWVWIGTGVVVYVFAYFFGTLPGGEETGTYVFMLFMYILFPPIWGGSLIFDYTEDRKAAKT